MNTAPLREADILKILARMAPPSVPDEALELSPNLQKLLAKLEPLATLALLASLMTDASLQPYGVRLDWAARMVLSHSRGRLTPRHKHLNAILNECLVEARVARLEDPIEDVFVEAVPTARGDFLIFTGLWEKAGYHTECVLRAFERLPDGEPKRDALEFVYGLLRLGDALVRRAGLSRGIVGEKIPTHTVPIPFDNRLKEVSRQALFTWDELEVLGIELPLLVPFTLSMNDATGVAQSVPGDTVAEFRPLVTTDEGILVALPANISTAIRALLIGTAVSGGMRKSLCERLMQVHDELLEESGFIKVKGFAKAIGDACLIREGIFEESEGRWVHVLQLTDAFLDWPESAFGSARMHPAVVSQALAENIRNAKTFMEGRPGYVDGVTVLILGGWGAPRGLDFDRKDGLEDWLIITLEPVDAIVLGACEDGAFEDIWRMYKQLKLVREQGFDFQIANGVLNLFEWWRQTDNSLVPPHMVDAKPPTNIAFDTSMLLAARQEAARGMDRRSVLHPNGTFHLVRRLNHKTSDGKLDPIYASLDSVREARMLGVVLVGIAVWWLELVNPPGEESSSTAYETWRAATEWLTRIMPPYVAQTQGADNSCLLVRLDVLPSSGRGERVLMDDEVERTVEVTADDAGTVTVTIKPEWHWALHRPDNQAEIVLAKSLLLAAGRSFGEPHTSAQLEQLIRDAVPGRDVRWRHSFEVHDALGRLGALGLIKDFVEISTSAGALQKCGTGWARRGRELGPHISGKTDCIAYLSQHADEQLARLRVQIAQFDRRGFIVGAFEAFQSALAEHSRWEMTARALRAIVGADQDKEISLRQSSLANGVIRGSSILIELATAEGHSEGKRGLGRMDMDELQALAMLYFHTVDMLAAIHGDRIEPNLRVSPTGDVLSDRSFEELTLQKSTEKLHKREREQASEKYVSRFDTEERVIEPYQQLRNAIQAEYGVDADALLDLPVASVSVVQKRDERGVMVIRRSEYIEALESLESMQGKHLQPLIDRLTLPYRTNWDEALPESTPRDFDLGKFDRRYSPVGRPIVALTRDDDPLLVIAPAVIERALKHNVMGAHGGSLQNEFWTHVAMREYASDRGRIEGLEFNDRVAADTHSLGLKAWPSVKPSWCLNRKATAELKSLGDIDALAVSPSGSIVWVIEAKDLKLCRTLGEAASRLSGYRGQLTSKGKPDNMLRHLRRVAYLRERASALVGRLGLAAIPKTVCGLVVVHAPQPMEQFPGEVPQDGRIVMLSEIASVPWDKGWDA